jgi:uncharacterized RDD family membrane protein YckC
VSARPGGGATATTATTAAAGAAPEYVGFWARVGATLIDTVWVLIVTAPLLLLVFGAGYFSLEHAMSGETDLKDLLISYGLPAVLVIAFWRRKLATPGKMAIHAQIVDARTLGPPTTGQLVIRYIGYFVSTIPLGLGLLWVAIDPRKQGWHDKLAGTVVIRVRRPGAGGGGR